MHGDICICTHLNIYMYISVCIYIYIHICIFLLPPCLFLFSFLESLSFFKIQLRWWQKFQKHHPGRFSCNSQIKKSRFKWRWGDDRNLIFWADFTPSKFNSESPWKMVLGRRSFFIGFQLLFRGELLNFGRVCYFLPEQDARPCQYMVVWLFKWSRLSNMMILQRSDNMCRIKELERCAGSKTGLTQWHLNMDCLNPQLLNFRVAFFRNKTLDNLRKSKSQYESSA